MMAFVQLITNGSRDGPILVPVKDTMQSSSGPPAGGIRKHRHDDEEQGKLFVGGLSWDTCQDSLLRYFSRFGEVIDCVVMKNADTGRSRRFGFVTFRNPTNVEDVLASCPHTLDGRTIDPKSCNPRSMQRPKRAISLPKVFLGGLPPGITETDLRTFFSRFGEVCEVVIMYDQEKKKSRGFGFLSFVEEAACVRAVAERYVCLQNKKVEIKRAEPRTHHGIGDQKLQAVGWNSHGQPPPQTMPQAPPPETTAFWSQVPHATPPPVAPALHPQPSFQVAYAQPPPSVTPQQQPLTWTSPTPVYATPPPSLPGYGGVPQTVSTQFWPPSSPQPTPPPQMVGDLYQGGRVYSSPSTPVSPLAAPPFPYQQQASVPLMTIPKVPFTSDQFLAGYGHMVSPQVAATPQVDLSAHGGLGPQRMAMYAQPSSQVQGYHPYRRS